MGLALSRFDMTTIMVVALVVGIIADFFMLGYVIAWALGL